MIKNIFMLAVLTFFISSCTLDVRTDELYNKNIEQEPQPEEDESDGEAVVGCKSFIQSFVEAMNISDCDEADVNLTKIIEGDCDEPLTLVSRVDQYSGAGCSVTCEQGMAYIEAEKELGNTMDAIMMFEAIDAMGSCSLSCSDMMIYVELHLSVGNCMKALTRISEMDALSCENTADALVIYHAAGCP